MCRSIAFARHDADLPSVFDRRPDRAGSHRVDPDAPVRQIRGEVDAGIVGRKRFVYEILGECVVDARRLALASNDPGIYMTAGFEGALQPVLTAEDEKAN